MTNQIDSTQQQTPTAHLRLGHRFFDALHVRHVARRFSPHFYDRFAIGIVESGACEITTPRGTWIARPGSLLTFSPGEVHSAELLPGSDYSYRMVYITAATLPLLELNQAVDGLPSTVFRSPVVEMPSTARVFGAAHRSLMQAGASEDLPQVESALLAELRLIVQRHSLASREPMMRGRALAAVEHAASRLVAPGSTHPSVAEVAEECNMSAFHFMRVFRRHVGASPYAYYLAYRVNRARQLLHQGLPLSHVAYSCGFSDQSHLNRMFKRVVGMPPGQYVRALHWTTA